MKKALGSFKVGDYVVYPSHGVGKITGDETQHFAGQSVSVYVISFDKDKMTLRVPVQRADRVGLRKLSTREDVKDALAVLGGRPKAARGMWSRRAQEYETKINSGNIVAVAEVIRDLHKNVDDPDRSYSERMIYESAVLRLAGEVAAIKGIPLADASQAITDSLRKKKEAKELEAA